MNKTKFYGCLGVLALAGTVFTACSDDDNNGGNENSSAAVWTVNGGINACDHVLFTESDKAGSKDVNDKGTQIGNGDQEFVFTGKQTLKKGTYILKGWVYIADGAELTIEPGTVIKGDKDTKAALIAERGGKLIAQGSETQPIVFTSEQAAGSRNVILRSLFTKILQRLQGFRCILNFIQNNQCVLRCNCHPGFNVQVHQNSLNIKIRLKDFIHSLIIIERNVCCFFIVLFSKFLHQPCFSHLSGTHND